MLREENVGDDGESVVTELAPSESYYPQHSRQRPHSFSTISEHQSTSSIRPRGEFHRVVIDRSDDASEEPPTRPTLEVPIPHYRLGLPQFNTAGSAAFQSSVGTRGSTPDYLCASRLAGENSNGSPLPNVYLGDSLIPERPSFVSSILSGTGAAAIELGPAPAEEAETSVFYEVKEPIEPSVFEDLVSDMDDESVVRYIPGTKDISAASPARIVAQISSESFMDYELVSDFFLTFRSYLSSSHLLALLLARLQWAINRWQDDGRIIRIRTFAALRHWILNYFVDDFLEDYGLRTYFCEAINSMYNDVKTREGGGTSDLKILIDLKRCWHGKCVMCWDAPELSAAYYHPDSPIVPGGVLEVTDGREAEEEEQPYQHGVQQADWPLTTGNTGVFDPVDVGGEEGGQQSALAQQQHYRHHSEATARSIPVSTQSDQSCFNVTSCSMRPKSPNRVSVPLSPNKAPHPVPLLPAKHNRSSQDPPKSSPVTSKRHPFYSHAHKRSGSFSDSVRDDRAPLPLLNLDQWSQEVLDSGSLIRGTLYAPAESYITMMAPPSPPLPLAGGSPALERQTTADETSKQASSSSGVKTIIGSIRRVFNSSKHGVQSATSSRHTRGPSGSPMRGGKTSALPNNVAFGSEFYRGRKNSAAMSKKPTRIDTLCDQVLKEYRQAIADREEAKDEPSPQLPQSSAAAAPQGEQGEEDLPTPRLQVPSQRPASGKGRAESGSGLTMGSESIVIVDDTGLDIPMVSGANGEPIVNFERSPTFLNAEDPPSTPKTMSLRVPSYNNKSSSSTRADDEYSLQIFYDDSGAVPSQRASKTKTFYDSESSSAASHRSGSVERDASLVRKKTSPSPRLRKYASFQSGISKISKHLPTMGSEVPLVVDPNIFQDEPGKHAGPVLRRRPGGDLRKMRHGRSPLSYFGSRSSASIVGSEATAPREVISRPQTSLVSSNPRHSFIQTNSSQDVRRSFEATIAKFSQIPDDDDGGVESTLLKLEGKWSDDTNIRDGAAAPVPEHGDVRYRRNVPILQQQQRNDAGDVHRRRQTVVGDSHARGRLVPLRPYSDSVADSEESFSSIPLLERGLSNESTKKPMAAHGPSSSTATPRPRLSAISNRNDISDRESSLDVVKETESMRRIPRGSTLPVPRPKTSRGRLSQLSSELSVDRQEAADGRPSMDTISLARSSFGIPPHPLAQPPSPPMTIQHPRSVTSCATPLNPVLVQARPLTPDTSPNRRNTPVPGRDRSATMQQQDVLSRSEHDQKQQQKSPNTLPDVDHVPFVLSCESALLAQQLTLVEMAALSEIDWRDLVEMRWSRASPSTPLNWVQFLTAENQDHRGIDLVVGRFNLMVKWVLSEIVLTPDIHERVQTISKFIHTAAHAKRLCNYATMLQIAIALSSTNCSRLEKTWSLVPPEDKRLLKDMEALIQPVRNFHDLRVEMETANLQEGCIPFVGRFLPKVSQPANRQASKILTNTNTGLYVHDLTYNAQKPGQITTQSGQPLINFERYRTTARIVKNLLRLIDASTKYSFQPVQGVIERCLWIASLSEEQIQMRSRDLD